MNYNNFDNHTSTGLNKINYITNNILFVADLPDETSEQDLEALFNNYHYITSKVTNRMGRAYALAHFESPTWAEKARNDLNGVKLTARYAKNKVGKPIRLCRYETRNLIHQKNEKDYMKNLLVKNLGKDVSAYLLWNTFKSVGEVRSSKLAVNYNGDSKGYGYVSYYNDSDAEKAKNKLNNTELGDKVISIEFLKPGLQKKPIIKNNIYVKHLPKENFGEEDLKKIFSSYGEIVSIMVVPDNSSSDYSKNKGFAFVCFKNSQDAEKAQNNLNGKKLFNSINEPLYVNFAMRKEERREHLQKKKEEQIKASYKMTLFCKIKDNVDSTIENEAQFINEIMKYFQMFFGDNYSPKSLKPKIDSKTAFITMNSPVEVNQFMKAYNEYSKINQVKNTLYFNQYKSKLERISNKKNINYNMFDNVNMISNRHPQYTNDFSNLSINNKGHPLYKNYNDFSQIYNPEHMINQPNINNYNNPQINQLPTQSINYNNFNQFDMNHNNISAITNNINIVNNPNINENLPESELKNQYLDHIYGVVSQIYPKDAPKITGMLAELSIDDLKGYVLDTLRLQSVIKSAHNQLYGTSDL